MLPPFAQEVTDLDEQLGLRFEQLIRLRLLYRACSADMPLTIQPKHTMAGKASTIQVIIPPQVMWSLFLP